MEANYFTILYWFCHTSTWIRHGCTCVPHPEPLSHLSPRTITLGHPSAPAPSILYPESNLDWRFISYIILYMFQCHSPKSSYPLPLPQSPKDFYTSVSLLPSHIQGYRYHLSKFHIYALVYCIHTVHTVLFTLFMGFSRQEYWSGLPFPSPVDHILLEDLQDLWELTPKKMFFSL